MRRSHLERIRTAKTKYENTTSRINNSADRKELITKRINYFSDYNYNNNSHNNNNYNNNNNNNKNNNFSEGKEDKNDIIDEDDYNAIEKFRKVQLDLTTIQDNYNNNIYLLSIESSLDELKSVVTHLKQQKENLLLENSEFNNNNKNINQHVKQLIESDKINKIKEFNRKMREMMFELQRNERYYNNIV